MRIVPNILSEKLFADLRAYSRKTKLVQTSTTQWHVDVVGWSSPIIQFPIAGRLLNRVKAELGEYVNTEIRQGEWHVTIHLGGTMSYIPWHNDHYHKVNMTVYLVEQWALENAGYFIYDDGDCLKAVLPQRNVGLIYEVPLMHSVAYSNTRAPLRESLQVFIN